MSPADNIWQVALALTLIVGVVMLYSDSVPSGDRAKALGWLTAATSAGVMVGPAIGSLSAAYGLIGPGYLAAILCVRRTRTAAV